MVNAQEWLDQNYPKEIRESFEELGIINKDLEGKLALEGFINLKKLECSNNLITKISLINLPKISYFKVADCRLTSLIINNCPEISFFHVRNNYFTDLEFLSVLDPLKLTFLSVNGNNFPTQDLTFFKRFVNLESLHIGTDDYKRVGKGLYNRFHGSLEPLKVLTKLKYLDIRTTDIHKGLEFLPESFKKITSISATYANERRDAGCLKIQKELEESAEIEGISEKLYETEEGEPEWAKGWERIAPWIEAKGKEEAKLELQNLHNSNGSKIEDLVNWTKRIMQKQTLLVDVLCQECSQSITAKDIYTGSKWCQFCNTRHFQEDFDKWASGNPIIDEFIQKYQIRATNRYELLEWVPYDRFKNIEYLAEGGFGRVYKAYWTDGLIDYWNIKENRWKRDNSWERGSLKRGGDWVILKSLNSSQESVGELLQEVTYHKLVGGGCVVQCFGISRDPTTKDYLIVLDYIPHGDLRQCLKNNHSELSIGDKIRKLYWTARGLKEVHDHQLVHCDFHTGNILNEGYGFYVTDLGLCRPANETDKKKIYGVLPYIAPEVLKGQSYTQVSDVYSFGMVAYELLTGLQPYHNLAHEGFLAVKICEGLRPKFPNNVRIPSLLKDFIKQCWDADPSKRPNEIRVTLSDFCQDIKEKRNTDFYKQYRETEEFNKKQNYLNVMDFFSYQTHPQAIYTSRLLDFKNLPKPQNSQEINEIFCKLSDELEELRITDPVKFSTELEKRFKEFEIKEKSQEVFMAESEELSPIEIPEQPTNQDWTNLDSNFTNVLIQQWQEKNFTTQQCKEWLNIGLQLHDYEYAQWLRDIVKMAPEEVLNEGGDAELRELFQEYKSQQQTQIEQSPK